jgi:hypothetical protein
MIGFETTIPKYKNVSLEVQLIPDGITINKSTIPGNLESWSTRPIK